jgi:hypothetical protein
MRRIPSRLLAGMDSDIHLTAWMKREMVNDIGYDLLSRNEAKRVALRVLTILFEESTEHFIESMFCFFLAQVALVPKVLPDREAGQGVQLSEQAYTLI